MIQIIQIKERRIAISGIGVLFFQDGFPISIAIDELSVKGVEVSLYHVIQECMGNGWSAKTTIRKLKGEADIDINKSMTTVNWDRIVEFAECLEEPRRSNGGYDRTREIIFEYLFNCTHEDVKSGANMFPIEWAKNALQYVINEEDLRGPAE